MRKEIETIKKSESSPKIIKNLYNKREIEEFLKLYNDLPITVHNKKQNVTKKRWLQGYNKKLEEIFDLVRLMQRTNATVAGFEMGEFS